jgi:outer membrane protein assembly factor BamA
VSKYEAILLLLLGFLGTSGSVLATDQVAIPSADTVGQVKDTTRLLTVNRVLIIGNKRTRDRIISRELSLKPGDTIRADKLNETLLWDKRKIYNLRLFNVVTIRSLEMSPTTIDLLVDVEERWYTWPAPIFELSDRNLNEWWQNYNHDFGRINYGIKLDQYNVRGRNETLRLTAQFGFTQRVELSYTIPYIDKKQKQGLIFNFSYGTPKNLDYFTQDHKLLYLNAKEPLRIYKSGTVTYTYRKSFFDTHSISLNYESAQVSDTIVALNPNYYFAPLNQQQFGSLSYSFKSEHRDVVMYPLKGYQFTGFIEKNGFGFDGAVNLWVANATYAYHQDLKKGYYLSNFSSLFLSDPISQPYSLYGALGYQKQVVRGYEIYVIEGPKFFVNKTTFKKKIFARALRWESMPLEQFRYLPFAVYLKSFVDLGYVENYAYYQEKNINTLLSNKLLAGYGTGLDIIFPYDVVFRMEYTFTREGTQGFFFNLKKEF